MESRFPLLTLLPCAPRPLVGRGGGGRKNAMVSRGANLPRLRSLASCGGGPAPDDAIMVPEAMAAAVPHLLALLSDPVGDLCAEAWHDPHLPVRLVKAAAFFGVPDAEIASMLELAHHRSSVARAAPEIGRAIAADAAARGAIRSGAAPGAPALSFLRPVPFGQPLGSVSPSGGGGGGGEAVAPDVPRMLDGLRPPPFRFDDRGAPFRAPPRSERRFATAARVAGAVPAALAPVLREFRGHLFVGGGAAAQAVLPHLNPVERQDVDLFVHGLTRAEADALLGRMGECLSPCPVFFTDNAVTFVLDPGMHSEVVVQVVLRLYASPDEALLGFDIAASGVMLCAGQEPGSYEAWGTASFFAAAATGAVWVDPERQSASYAWRFLKYWARGFDVLLFGLPPMRRVAADVFERDNIRAPALQGLAEILRLEHDMAACLEHSRCRSNPARALHFITRLRARLPTSNYEDSAPDYGALEYASRGGVTRISDDSPVGETSFTWQTREPGSQVTGSFAPRKSPFYAGTITGPNPNSPTSPHAPPLVPPVPVPAA